MIQAEIYEQFKTIQHMITPLKNRSNTLHLEIFISDNPLTGRAMFLFLLLFYILSIF